ncbi:3-oxoacid CoA-transferase [Kwoniella heveanensis CBS 569]|uniref:Succinyl-CoA:3-ketoacid-coenzyme A transferase n=1 Tax=Kwoniella heveanensis BCC8398 TaxID=1296120 RepID=A0A1B9GHI0_9TREE|nr:3-oxoacid CoA-transferase [Kwoniella heveanensis BCC8398]OCF42833.1 3-oxoacid CoA-transferase [Kwoniella heveanensis CBS 569]
MLTSIIRPAVRAGLLTVKQRRIGTCVPAVTRRSLIGLHFRTKTTNATLHDGPLNSAHLTIRARRGKAGASNQGKVWVSAEEAVKDLQSGSLILSAGFGLCGTAETIIGAIRGRPELKDLTVVSNNAGDNGKAGLAPLVTSRQISKIILSYVGTNKGLEKAYLAGEIAMELCPQGSIAERLRAGGNGVPGFYTRTGANTLMETGGIPQKLASPVEDGSEQTVLIPGVRKEVREFDGKKYLFEPAIRGDVAILRAWKVDRVGNCVFRYTTKAFAGLAARAAKLTIVEAENIVEVGDISPMDVDLPGIYVDRIVPATVQKKTEIITLKEDDSSASSSMPTMDKDAARIRREKIAKRAAQELKDGFYCNLGVGMPVLAASFLPDGVKVWLQSENGILGMGPYPTRDEVDPDLINAGKETVTLMPGASVFDSSESFGMIRGGHVDVSVLGAMEVSASGDLANYMIPGKLVKGPGGAMDLISNPDETTVIVVTDHLDKKGKPKVVQDCSLPLTGARCVSKIITDLAVFSVDRTGDGGLTLLELAEGVDLEHVKRNTACHFKVTDNLGSF